MSDDNVRYCDSCGKEMHEGYCIDDGLEYYCSDDCLSSVMTKSEYLQAYNEGWAYWTTWE